MLTLKTFTNNHLENKSLCLIPSLQYTPISSYKSNDFNIKESHVIPEKLFQALFENVKRNNKAIKNLSAKLKKQTSIASSNSKKSRKKTKLN